MKISHIFNNVHYGNHNDGIAGDGYGCKISNCSNSIDYYVYADMIHGIFSKRASFEFYNLTFQFKKKITSMS